MTSPVMYGSAGEPTLGDLPPVYGRTMRPSAGPMGSPMGIPIGLLMAGLFNSRNADAPQTQPMPNAQMPQAAPAPEQEMPTLDIMSAALPFGKAFATARKMGLVEFTWRGANYTTKYKEE